MDEYISRETAVRYLEEYSNREACKSHPFSMIITSVLEKAKRVLSEIPAADVQPVRRGKWTKEDIPVFTYKCSICGDIAEFHYDYCPYCGARMDFKEENNYAK